MTRYALLWLLLALWTGSRPVTLTYPSGWPRPVYDFEKYPLTREGIALGRRLFYDPVLSADSTVSCSSCHLSYTAFTHTDHPRSHGIGDRVGRRNAMALQNLAWSAAFMWDGAVPHLNFQALAPIHDSLEMGSDIRKVIHRLEGSATYRRHFTRAFGSPGITTPRLLRALAQFELSLVSASAPYDRIMAGRDTFTAQEARGYQLFRDYCNRCHTEPLFAGNSFEQNGLPPDPTLMDWGRMRVTGQPADSLRFKVPSLRNIAHSQPYMHDGRFTRLKDVLAHYTSRPALFGGHALTAPERVELTAFLLTLTDRDFLFNPQHAFPRSNTHN
jgi:cytochrome c peroxidase